MIIMILFYILLFLQTSIEGKFLFFERQTYEYFVSESTPTGTRIAFIQATASDSLTIHYQLHGDTNRTFSLDSTTGELLLANSLDYEKISIYTLAIEARASGKITPSFSQVIIHVINTNDNPPEINLIFYPSIVSQSNLLIFDRLIFSTPLGTISIKDLDRSTKNLSLTLNDTDHFQVQFIRQTRNGFLTEAMFILSTKNNSQLNEHHHYYLSLKACDSDQPMLCTNRSYELKFESTEQFCNFSLNGTNNIVDIPENLPNGTLILHLQTNNYCPKKYYAIDDRKNFFINSQTGDLYTSIRFNRQQQSIYRLHVELNQHFKQEIFIRLLNEQGRKAFLSQKTIQSDREEFHSIDLFNGTCRSQPIIYQTFQLLSNCTLLKLSKPLQGKYLFFIHLNDSLDYEDTFLLEITAYRMEKYVAFFLQSPWIILLVICLACLSFLFLISCLLVMIRKQNFNHHQKKKQAPASLSNSEENIHQKYDAISTLPKLKVHDEQELSPSSTNTTIYLVQRPSPPLSSASPGHEDEGYSGSSDVSDNPIPIESTILAANRLFEKYCIHEFRARQSLSPSYDSPKRFSSSCVSADVSLV